MRIAIFAIFSLVLFLAPSLIDARWTESYGAERFEPPSAAHILGTDHLGRDLFAETLAAGRETMLISVTAAFVAFGLGLGLAVLTGLSSGFGSSVLARSMDALIAIPGLIVAFVLIAALGSSTSSLIAVIIVVEFCRVFRSLRAPVAQVIAQPFVELSRIRGEGIGYLIFRDVWPNIRAYAAVELINRFVSCLMFLSALSVLGLGVQPPASDWGTLIKLNAAGLLLGSPAPILPGLFILTTSLLALWAVGEERLTASRNRP
ncbi:ABC transporter permease [Bradyrhizobium sp. CCBAU 21360]|uniref:ABC transporter permease n=1 Tax=Bradyrhizobium sp. CCBAU 21360 TaxID=1325081 RepID=UPI0023056D63|nr:ABC transporter permease [Bradyrhizobium sp. CCBAU 21360]